MQNYQDALLRNNRIAIQSVHSLQILSTLLFHIESGHPLYFHFARNERMHGVL